MTSPLLETTAGCIWESSQNISRAYAKPMVAAGSAAAASARESMRDVLAHVRAEVQPRKLFFLGLVLFIVTGNYITGVVLGAIDALQGGIALSRSLLAPSLLHFATLGSVPIVVGSLLLEARLMGWERSSLHKLFRAETRSIRSDLIYAALYCSRLKLLLGLVMSLGLAYTLRAHILVHFDYGLLRGAPFLLMLAVQFLVGSFVLYVWHRLCHTRFFWEFHKVHHAGEDMTMINNFRDHPVFDTLRLTIETLPAALLGVTPMVLIVYAAVVGALSLWFHSDYDWKMPFVEKYLLIGSKAHRIHHSLHPRHHHKNFGWLVLWERVFGTYCEDPDDIPIGLEDPRFNRQGTFAEMWATLGSGTLALFREIGAVLSFPAPVVREITRVQE